MSGHWFHARSIYAQQNANDYNDGTFYISAAVEVDSNYTLYTDSYMEVDLRLSPCKHAVRLGCSERQRKWIPQGMNNGRVVEYDLEYWPTKANSLGAPTTFTNAIITEHLTSSMAYGTGSNGVISGQFTDVLGNTSGMNGGTYVSDRYFMVNSNGQNLGHIMTYDAAGKHATDHIEIHLPKGPSILNRYTK